MMSVLTDREDFMNYDTCNGLIYVIKSGDTLYKISGSFGVPVALILRANPYIDIYNLQPGDRICIPVTPEVVQDGMITYIINDMDTLESVLKRFNISLSDLIRYNNMNTLLLKPGTSLNIPDMSGITEEYLDDYMQ